MCICTFLLLDRKKCGIVRYIYQVYTPAATIATLCLIGTKTAFAAVGVACGGLLGYSLYLLIAKKQKTPLIRLVIMALACLILLGILALFSGNLFADISSSLNNTGNIARREGVTTALLSGRQNKLGEAFQDFREGGVYKWLFGITRGSQKAIIEMDVFEVLFYYGLAGGGLYAVALSEAGIRLCAEIHQGAHHGGLCSVLQSGPCAPSIWSWPDTSFSASLPVSIFPLCFFTANCFMPTISKKKRSENNIKKPWRRSILQGFFLFSFVERIS